MRPPLINHKCILINVAHLGREFIRSQLFVYCLELPTARSYWKVRYSRHAFSFLNLPLTIALFELGCDWPWTKESNSHRPQWSLSNRCQSIVCLFVCLSSAYDVRTYDMSDNVSCWNAKKAILRIRFVVVFSTTAEPPLGLAVVKYDISK